MSSLPGQARLLGVLAFAVAIAWPLRTRACASCSCGDPTLTAVGVEQPYKNRLRLAIDERVEEHISGGGLARVRFLSLRTQLGVAYTPHARVTLAAVLPFVASRVLAQDGSESWVRGLGDLELQARVLVARDRGFAPRHLFWLAAGLKMPTGPRVYDDAGFPYPDDEQPGSGSWDPLAGAVYAWFGHPLAIYSSLFFRFPTTGPRGYRFGSSVLSSTVAQLQPLRRLAVQLGATLRYSQPDALSNGAAAPDTGGFIAAGVVAVLVNPWRDLLVRVAGEVPVVQALRGVQSMGPQLVVTLSYDVL